MVILLKFNSQLVNDDFEFYFLNIYIAIGNDFVEELRFVLWYNVSQDIEMEISN